MEYRAASWFWLVTSRPGEVYASARFAYFPLSDALYQAFVTGGGVATRIPNEAELREVLSLAGVRYLTEALPALEDDRPRVARARVRLVAASFAIQSATPRSVPWSNELLDPIGMHEAAPNPERITIVQPGWYRIVAGVRFTEGASPTGMRALQVARGLGASPEDLGTVRLGCSPSGNTAFGVTEFVQAAAGDVLRAFVEHNQGAALNAVARITLLREE